MDEGELKMSICIHFTWFQNFHFTSLLSQRLPYGFLIATRRCLTAPRNLDYSRAVVTDRLQAEGPLLQDKLGMENGFLAKHGNLARKNPASLLRQELASFDRLFLLRLK